MAPDQNVREFDAVGSACSRAARPSIRPVRPEDGPAIHALLTACIPDVLTDRQRWLARWQWQYWNNPYRQDRPVGYVLADEERVLGHLGAVYLPLRIQDSHAISVTGSDYAVGEEGVARGGVFAALELAQRLFTDCRDCVVMATTANEKTGAVFGRFGCKPVEWTREFWRASTGLPQEFRSCCGGRSRLVRRALNTRLGPLLTRGLMAGFKAAGRTPPIPIRFGCSLETTVPQLARDLGQLGESVRRVEVSSHSTDACTPWPKVALNRSQEYLDWRYAGHPERDHIRVLVVRNARGRPLGAAIIFREERPDRHVMYIEDLLVPPDRRDVARTLLCAALRLATQGGAEYLVTSPGHRSMRDLYWELGFESRARNAPAVVLSLPSQGADPQARSSSESLHDQIEFWHGMMF